MSAVRQAQPFDDADRYQRWHVEIGWRLGQDASTCTVRVSWLGQLIATQQLGATCTELPFSARSPHDRDLHMAGRLAFNPATGSLLLALLQCPDGTVHDVVLVPPTPCPPPPAPVEDDDESSGQLLIEEIGDLFPFIHLRDWPALPARAAFDRFMFYADASPDVDAARLYQVLAAIDRTGAGARQAMLEQALAFVQDQPPYQGQWAADPACLGPDFVALATFSKAALELDPPTVEGVHALACEQWHAPWLEIVERLASPGFHDTVDRAWQNVFALCCIAGYALTTLQQLIACLRAAQLLQHLALLGDAPHDAAWTPQRLRAALQATLVLPAPVFPLPAAGAVPPGQQDSCALLPYAIGELCQVKRRLLGYTLGAISHIENVMADEKKVRAQHDLLTTGSEHLAREQQDDAQDTVQEGSRLTLDAQVNAAVREHFQIDYVTQYGPPTEGRQTGSYTMSPVGDAPVRERQGQHRELARHITQRGAQRLSSQLTEQRLERRHHSRRSEASQCFNRRGRERNQRGIYRWLDARFECWIERVGRRLMLEYFVPAPARRFITAHRQQLGIDLAEPLAPAQLGLHNAQDISLDPTSECYYVSLCARYGVELKEEPPAATAYACATLDAGAALTCQRIALPEGYAAATATLSRAAHPASLRVDGYVGAASFALMESPSTVSVTLAGQTGWLPVSIAAPVDTAIAETSYGINIEVGLTCMDAHLSAWKARLYGRLQLGYRQCRADYLQAAGVAPGARVDPQSQQRAIRQELTRAGQSILLQWADRNTGEYAEGGRLAPSLQLWMASALEWSQMSYTLIDDPEAVLSMDATPAPFTSFLQARCARVLLPVSAEHERAVLYFLASGMLWSGHDAMAPVFESTLGSIDPRLPSTQRYLDLVAALESVNASPEPPPPGEAWSLTLPTDLSVLQDGDALPAFVGMP